jgi:hypothetical protein
MNWRRFPSRRSTGLARVCSLARGGNWLSGLLKKLGQRPAGGWDFGLPMTHSTGHHTQSHEQTPPFKKQRPWAFDLNQRVDICAHFQGF